MNKYAPSPSPCYYYYPHFLMYSLLIPLSTCMLCSFCTLHFVSYQLHNTSFAFAFYGLLNIAYDRRAGRAASCVVIFEIDFAAL
jgi:hypothetical protein